MNETSPEFDKEASLAILIGVFDYSVTAEPLSALKPHVENNLDALTALFTDESVLGFKYIDTLRNPTRNRILFTLSHHSTLSEKFYDTILVYYAGHGIFDSSSYYLTGSDSHQKVDRTCINFSTEFLPAVREFRCKRLILMIDACYSERATMAIHSERAEQNSEADSVLLATTSYLKGGRARRFTIVSSSTTDGSRAESDHKSYTGFGAVLVDTLRGGIPDLDRPRISLHELALHARQVAVDRGLPAPPIPARTPNDLGDWELLSNRAHGAKRVFTATNKAATSLSKNHRLGNLNSLGNVIVGMLVNSSPIAVWGIPIVCALILIYSSTFLGIDRIRLPHLLDNYQEWAACSSVGKEVGLFSSPNWSIVYIVLFPAYLACIRTFILDCRRCVDSLIDDGSLIDSFGHSPERLEVQGLMDEHIASLSLVLIWLFVAVITLTIGGWIISTASALWHSRIGTEVVDWSTIAIVCWPGMNISQLLLYTFTAMVWMGLALFVYFACLFLGYQLAAFMGALADPGTDSRSHGRGFRVLWTVDVFSGNVSHLFRIFSLATILGLFAGYFMRLQALYLVSSYTDIGSFWMSDTSALTPTEAS